MARGVCRGDNGYCRAVRRRTVEKQGCRQKPGSCAFGQRPPAWHPSHQRGGPSGQFRHRTDTRIQRLRSRAPHALGPADLNWIAAKPDSWDGHTAIILAHGAGQGMHSPFMTYFHTELALGGFLAVKFNFDYMDQGRKVPDP